MSKDGYTLIRASMVEGFQHAKDDYWFRPLVFGKNLFTYLAYVPPGGSMPPHGHEEDPYELSFYMLAGALDLTLGSKTFRVTSGDAVRVLPTVSLGVANTGSATAAFLLTFSPPPPIESLEKLRESFAKRGGGLRPAAQMNSLWSPGGPGQGGAASGNR